MEYLSKKFKQTKKAIAHYWNPNQNPTEKQKKALQLLDRAQVDMFIQFLQQNSDVNINVVDFNKASLLIKAQDVANNTNQYKKLFSNQQLIKRASQAVNYLLKRGVDINYRDKNGITALMSACHWENKQIAQLLLQNGADPNIGTNINGFITTPLLSSYFKKNLPIVNLLLQHNASAEQAIECSKLTKNGVVLAEADINFLRSLANIAKLTRKRKQQQVLKKNSLLSQLSDMAFQQICYNI